MILIFKYLPYILFTGLLALLFARLTDRRSRRTVRVRPDPCYHWDDSSTRHD